MKKIALLLSGLPRMWQPSLQTQLDMLQEHDVDVFFHFWDTIDQPEKDALLALLKPKACMFDPPRDFSEMDRRADIKHDKINVPSRITSQFYSWSRVAQLFAPYVKDYDFALRSRSDLQFVYSIAHAFNELKPNDLVVSWALHERLVSDIFAFGGAEAIHFYLTLYDQLEEYIRTCDYNPEALLTHHLGRRTDIHIYTEDFKFFFIRRPHMTDYTIEQCLAEDYGANKWLNPEVVENHRQFFGAVHGEDGIAHVEAFRAKQIARIKRSS